jgi:hypothetical protein
MKEEFEVYVIAFKDEENQYIDLYDGSSSLRKAMKFYTYDDAETHRRNIDVAYLFEVRKINAVYEDKNAC